MWARLAAVGLGGVVAVVMITGKFAADAPTRALWDRAARFHKDVIEVDTIVPVAEFGESLLAEAIVIKNNPPNVNIEPVSLKRSGPTAKTVIIRVVDINN